MDNPNGFALLSLVRVALARLTRRASPLSAWLKLRRENPEAATAEGLFSALTLSRTPRWRDHVQACKALGGLELTDAQRAQANSFLSQILQRPPKAKLFYARLTRSLAASFLISLPAAIVTMISQLSPDYPTDNFNRLASVAIFTPLYLIVISPLVFGGLSLIERRRTKRLYQVASATLTRISEAVTATTEEDDAEIKIETELPNLNLYPWRECVSAFKELGTTVLSTQERNHFRPAALRALMQPESRSRFSRLGSAVAIASCSGLVVAGFLFALFLGTNAGVHLTIDVRLVVSIVSLIVTSVAIPISFSALSLVDFYRNSHVQRAAAELLGKIGDVESLLSLYIHTVNRSPACVEARAAIKAILPSLSVDWYGRLPAGLLQALTNLSGSTDESLALLSLDALEKAGDGTCVRAVERIATRGKTEQVRERAEAVLPTLLARRERESAANTLLRASEARPTEHLLRPAYGTAPEVTNLLRASQADAPNSQS